VMASQAPLALFQDYLTELAETFRKNPSVATNRSNRSTANSLQDVLLSPLAEMARSRSRAKTDVPDMLVISLPVQIQAR
jgi:hypothetical protein